MHSNKRNGRFTKSSDVTNADSISDPAARYTWAVRGMDPWTRRWPI